MFFAISRVIMQGLFKIAVLSVVVVTVGSAAAVLLLPPSSQEQLTRRQREAQRLVDQIAQEVWNYHHDTGRFPPGDGSGSAGLVRALRAPSPSGEPYLRLTNDMLTPTGDLRNPVAPELEIIYYRNNTEKRDPNRYVHNLENFDLWGKGGDGAAYSVNNWYAPSPF